MISIREAALARNKARHKRAHLLLLTVSAAHRPVRAGKRLPERSTAVDPLQATQTVDASAQATAPEAPRDQQSRSHSGGTWKLGNRTVFRINPHSHHASGIPSDFASRRIRTSVTLSWVHTVVSHVGRCPTTLAPLVTNKQPTAPLIWAPIHAGTLTPVLV